MTEIVLDEQQTRQFVEAVGTVLIRDASGNAIAFVTVNGETEPPKLAATDLADLNRRLNKPKPRWHSTQEVLQFLDEQAP